MLSLRPATPADADAVLALADDAARADGVAPLNEESRLAVRALGHTTQEDDKQPDGGHAPRILVATAAGEDDALAGVVVDAQGDAGGVDLVVSPARRGQGLGRELLDAFESQADGIERAAYWAHGDLPSAQAFARHVGADRVRDLWRMTRPVTPDEAFVTDLPDGFEARAYDGSSEQGQAWLDVNAAAFVHHPEQGRMTMADFRERAGEDWFDPSGLILVWDVTGAQPVLAASHWTKREPGSDEGEVYVVAVAPAYQGRGLAKPLTGLGLAHLAQAGVRAVDLYVEGDNEPAKATYTRAGFTKSAQDVMYVHTTARGLQR